MLKKILIADDMMTVVTMVKYILEEQGYTVVTASDGIEAIEKVYGEMPDLVIADLMMPRMNGYQLCRLLKDDSLTSHIPIIILTGQDKPIDKFWAKQTGADEYLLKDSIEGFQLPELIKTVKKLLQSSIQTKIKEAPKKQINEAEIFSKVNDLLDKNLLQSTVLNEISYFGRSIYDQESTVQSILNLLQNIIKFDIALLFLGEEKNVLVYSKEKQPDKNVDMGVVKALSHYNKSLGLEISKDGLNIKTIKSGGDDTPVLSPNEVKSFLSMELFSRNNIMGILVFGSYQEDTYLDVDEKFINSIINQVSIVMDNTRLYHKIEALSITDELTKMYNKRHLSQIIPLEMNRVERYNRPLCLIMFDIDYFKKVNDTYGHLQGDIILREIARIARESLRKVDIPIRYGGEEFMILLPEVELETVKKIAERIRKSIEEFSFPGQKEPLHVTVSLGVGVCTKELLDEDGKKLIALVDNALYQAKKSGRNKVCIAC